ncbi:MAG: hypothetical protein QXY75_03040 [Candidatus Bathyarchaeia archaeon]
MSIYPPVVSAKGVWEYPTRTLTETNLKKIVFTDSGEYTTTAPYTTVVTFNLTPSIGKLIRIVGIIFKRDMKTADSLKLAYSQIYLPINATGYLEASTSSTTYVTYINRAVGPILISRVNENVEIDVQIRATEGYTAYITNIEVTVYYEEV